MAIIIETSDPQSLIKAIYHGVDENDIRTWARIGKTNKLTHVPDQYEYRASFSPKKPKESTQLIFEINFPPDADPNRVRRLYGIYHGRFMEMLLSNFHTQFSALGATSKPKSYDEMTEKVRIALNK